MPDQPDLQALDLDALRVRNMQQAAAQLSAELREAKAENERRVNDYIGACELAWRLYLAGTSQSNDTFHGVGLSGPVEEVEQRIEALNDLAIRAEQAEAQLRTCQEALQKITDYNISIGYQPSALEMKTIARAALNPVGEP